jgi:hypothetical protein
MSSEECATRECEEAIGNQASPFVNSKCWHWFVRGWRLSSDAGKTTFHIAHKMSNAENFIMYLELRENFRQQVHDQINQHRTTGTHQPC